jgi:alpha-amylase
MPAVCFYFEVHQPQRLKTYDCFRIGHEHTYDDAVVNKAILDRVAYKCYLPANKIILELIQKTKGQFRVAYSISGTALEQFERYRPDVLASFRQLANTGCVEFLCEAYYHSLAFVYSKEEFIRQVGKHREKIESLFGQTPRVFRNTELIYSNEIGQYVNNLGFDGILCEGLDHILGYRSPNFLHHPPNQPQFACLLKNYRLSDDIAFRFSDRNWTEWPLTAETFANWVHHTAGNGDTVNLFMDYETFGEHQWRESGIFEFLKRLPKEILRHPDFRFMTPSEVIDTYPTRGEYDVPYFSSWADLERDLSAWLGNPLQHDAMERAYKLEHRVKELDDPELLATWSNLLTSDHYYYMCTKHWQDGDVHKYFSPYHTPYDAYINLMNVLTDFEYVLELHESQSEKEEMAAEVHD